MTALTPPGGPAHVFDHTAVDLEQSYARRRYERTDPDELTIQPGPSATRVQRPDGSVVQLGYDAAGGLATVSYPGGTLGYSYDATTGPLGSIAPRPAWH